LRNWSHGSSPRRGRRAVRSELGWADDQVIALHAGNMGLKQDLDNVVEAARLAAEVGSKIHFVLMGDGSQREHLARTGADVPNLSILPSAPPDVYPEMIAAADVLLVNELASAVSMSLPSKLTTYFQVGVPVVAAVPRDGGTATEVNGSGAGLVTAPGDPSALLSAVARIANSEELRQQLAKAGPVYVRQFLGAEATLQKLGEHVQRLASASQSRARSA
jgi:colanic acid biosynthesis glycosyl transferase WcaI